MMKKLIWTLMLGVELAACKQTSVKKPVITTIDSTKPQNDSIQQHTDTTAAIAQPSDTTITPPPPPGNQIRPLPFGPAGSTAKNFFKKDPWFFYRLIGEGYTLQHDYFTKFTTAYPLPPIEKYTHAADESAREFCLSYERQIPVDSLFAINHYRLRLPDHKGFEVYYTTGDAAVDTLFPQQYKTCEMNYKLYGYLIFYERATKTAHLLPAFYHWFGETLHSRRFYIDSNYRIFTYYEWMGEGDDSEASINAGPVYEVTINSKGDFITKPVKK